MELENKFRNRALNELTIMKVFLENSENIRDSFVEYFSEEGINEDNLYDVIDSYLAPRKEEVPNISDDDYLKLLNSEKEFKSKVLDFLTEESLYDKKTEEFKIGFNKRILSSLKPFCCNNSIVEKSFLKKKAATISNTEFKNNLKIKEVLKKESTFNVESFNLQAQMTAPVNRVNENGIEYLDFSPLIKNENINGNEVVTGEINIKLKPYPMIKSNEFVVIEKDSNGEIIGNYDLDYFDSKAEKTNIINSLNEKIIGKAGINSIFSDESKKIKGRMLISHKIDYTKLNNFIEKPDSIPSVYYEYNTSNGKIKYEFDENFKEYFKNFINFEDEYNLEVGNNYGMAYTDLKNMLINFQIEATDKFSDTNMYNEVSLFQKSNEISKEFLNAFLNYNDEINKSFSNPDLETSSIISLYLLNKYLIDNPQLEDENKDFYSDLIEGLNNIESILEEKSIDKSKFNSDLKDKFDEICSIAIKLNSNSLKNFQLELLRLNSISKYVINQIIDKQMDKALDFAFKVNNGSLKNDRTFERKVFESLGNIQKNLGLKIPEIMDNFISEKISSLEKNINLLENNLHGVNEIMDCTNRKEFPIVNINNIPDKPEGGKRVISYDIETGGLKAETCGLSQFTALVVDYDKENNPVKKFFVDEYTNPEQNPLPIIGRDNEGFIFGKTCDEFFAFTKPLSLNQKMLLKSNADDFNSMSQRKDIVDAYCLSEDNYHLWRTNNPNKQLYDFNGDKIELFYPRQNIGAIETHGITNEQLVDKPNFRDIREGLNNLFKTSDKIIGFNIEKFDNNFLIGLAKKNGLDLEVDPHKNLDLRWLSGGVFTKSQIKNYGYDSFKNGENVSVENNKMFFGGTLNALSNVYMVSLASRYNNGVETHDAKADTFITQNLGTATLSFSKELLNNLKEISKQANIEFKENEICKDNEIKTIDSDYLSAMKILTQIDQVYTKSLNSSALERQLENVDPTIKTMIDNTMKNLDTKINKKSSRGREDLDI